MQRASFAGSVAQADKGETIPRKCDVAVIGSGIGGLVCANYLAKAGASVVLIEKHYIPGGYCSSFSRKGYYFDAGAHYLGSCRSEGQIGRLIQDHGLQGDLQLIKCDPSEVVVSKNHATYIYGDAKRTTEELVENFPEEASGIRKFIHYISATEPVQLYVDLQAISFRDLLDQYFKGWEIKSVLATLLGNIGLPSFRASALTSVFLFREFIFDGGYYPRGGMQRFPNVLLERLISYGGRALLLSPAKEIVLTEGGRVHAIRIKYRGKEEVEIQVKAVVANCDPFQIFGQLIRRSTRSQELVGFIGNRIPTVSAFMVHLGVKDPLALRAKYTCNIWSYLKGNIDDYYEGVVQGNLERGQGSFLFCSIPTFHDSELLAPDHHSIQTIIAAPYADRKFWDANKAELAQDVINRLERYIPGVRDVVEVEQIATPATLVKYTWSYRGAMYGWASTIDQVGRQKMPEETPIDGLYIVGHWTGLPSGHSGIPTVVTSGRNVARLVLRRIKRALLKE